MAEQEKWYTNEARKLLLKERYFNNSHNYFFEVKEAKNGSKYIVIDQRKKVKDKFVGVKIRIFEDEMLEFERVLHKLIDFSLKCNQGQEGSLQVSNSEFNQTNAPNFSVSDDLAPAFFRKLVSTNDWKEFEHYTHYLLKLLGIPLTYTFLNQQQAGRADGFFKIGHLAVIYDCTLCKSTVEHHKSEQVNNYCNRLRQGIIEVSQKNTEEFYDYHKQVWIITRNKTRSIKVVNSIEVKEIAVQDMMSLYQDRLTMTLSDQSLEMRLRNL